MVAEDDPMTRPVVPEAEGLIGAKVPVLTHGFVALVDYMGNDAAIVQAARVSYGKGTKSVRDDRGLIRYLMRHRHTTPFEMVEYKFLVRLPIFVARQWIRHRTACLAEGTRVYFDLPGGIRRQDKRRNSLAIEELWRRFQPTRNRRAGRQPNRFWPKERVLGMRVRQLDEAHWRFGHTRVVGVSKNGPKPVFRMRLADGKVIDCTADHRFLFAEGWATLAEKTGLHEQHGHAVWSSGQYEVSVNGAEVVRPALYQDRGWFEEAYIRQARTLTDIGDACGVTPGTISLWARRHGFPGRPPSSSPFVRGNTLSSRRRSRRRLPNPRRVKGSGHESYRSRAWLEVRWIQGHSSGEIAAECGCSVATIRKWLRLLGLTHHPLHPTLRPFLPGHVPWNKGRTYRLGARGVRPTQLAAVRAARSGSASNFWKGGTSRERDSIGRWTTQVARSVHERNHWTCQLCLRRQPVLQAHHIVPVWADLPRARDPFNLTTLCDECHREVHKDETAYVGRLGGPPMASVLPPKPRPPVRRLVQPLLVRVQGFEFLGNRMTYDLEVEGPFHNFVANGIVTHNSVNEYSARYSVVPDEYELPPIAEIRYQSQRSHQGGGESVPTEVAEEFRADLDRVAKDAYEAYGRALHAGVARETARLILPVAYYTQWYWKINLWNLLHFLSLRLDPHAQEEIRLYAAEVAKIARVVCPVAFEAFEEFELRGLSLGRREQVAVRALLDGKTPEAACKIAGLPLQREDGRPMTSGEGVEFLEKLERLRHSE